MKTKKIGICRREIIKPEVKDSSGNIIIKAVLGNLSMTDGDLKGALRSALRKIWTSSTRRIFLEEIRFPDRSDGAGKWLVQCDECGTVMKLSQKAFGKKADGSPTKREKLVYEVDHLESLTLIDLDKDLAKYVQDLFYGEMRVLCRYPCHAERTKEQKQTEKSRSKKL